MLCTQYVQYYQYSTMYSVCEFFVHIDFFLRAKRVLAIRFSGRVKDSVQILNLNVIRFSENKFLEEYLSHLCGRLPQILTIEYRLFIYVLIKSQNKNSLSKRCFPWNRGEEVHALCAHRYRSVFVVLVRESNYKFSFVDQHCSYYLHVPLFYGRCCFCRNQINELNIVRAIERR